MSFTIEPAATLAPLPVESGAAFPNVPSATHAGVLLDLTDDALEAALDDTAAFGGALRFAENLLTDSALAAESSEDREGRSFDSAVAVAVNDLLGAFGELLPTQLSYYLDESDGYYFLTVQKGNLWLKSTWERDQDAFTHWRDIAADSMQRPLLDAARHLLGRYQTLEGQLNRIEATERQLTLVNAAQAARLLSLVAPDRHQIEVGREAVRAFLLDDTITGPNAGDILKRLSTADHDDGNVADLIDRRAVAREKTGEIGQAEVVTDFLTQVHTSRFLPIVRLAAAQLAMPEAPISWLHDVADSHDALTRDDVLRLMRGLPWQNSRG